MAIEFSPTLVGVVISGVAMLLTLAATWGSLHSQLKGIHKRLDRVNGRLDVHGKDITNQGQRIAHLEGGQPRGGRQ